MFSFQSSARYVFFTRIFYSVLAFPTNPLTIHSAAARACQLASNVCVIIIPPLGTESTNISHYHHVYTDLNEFFTAYFALGYSCPSSAMATSTPQTLPISAGRPAGRLWAFESPISRQRDQEASRVGPSFLLWSMALTTSPWHIETRM